MCWARHLSTGVPPVDCGARATEDEQPTGQFAPLVPGDGNSEPSTAYGNLQGSPILPTDNEGSDDPAYPVVYAEGNELPFIPGLS